MADFLATVAAAAAVILLEHLVSYLTRTAFVVVLTERMRPTW
ncbi:MAG: hypothetical protein ACRDTG_14900 [Pseudonocardiaceae bacterium]